MGAAATYACAADFARVCIRSNNGSSFQTALHSGTPPRINGSELSSLLARQAHNIGTLGHSPTTQPPAQPAVRTGGGSTGSTGSGGSGGSYFVPRLGFEVLESIVRARLQVRI